jgi:hypothetical protein
MSERRGTPPADDRGRVVDELVVAQGFDHEQGEVGATRDVAHRIRNVRIELSMLQSSLPSEQSIAYTCQK